MHLKIVILLFFVSLFLFLLMFVLVAREVKVGQRVFAVKIRGYLDKVISVVLNFISCLWSKTGLLYSRYLFHFFIVKAMSVTVAVYEYLEKLFYGNRKEIKRIRLLNKKKS